jgi:hypothetical protein
VKSNRNTCVDIGLQDQSRNASGPLHEQVHFLKSLLLSGLAVFGARAGPGESDLAGW